MEIEGYQARLAGLSKAKGDYKAIELSVSVAGRIMRYLKLRPA